ncbi:hypothetical protein [uncultured Azohydromonas sp.]|uniref:hypothetical protein n=1 Tax=uncultured Azohydromonas sp. TaxID=487342 RepID=UPI00260A764F|nr:hypothetical protein [uncultured Azohydromonas sp.]
MRDRPPVHSHCTRAFRVILALALATAVLAWFGWRMGGFEDGAATLRTLAVAGMAGALGYALAKWLLLAFVVGMAPVLVLLALLGGLWN